MLYMEQDMAIKWRPKIIILRGSSGQLAWITGSGVSPCISACKIKNIVRFASVSTAKVSLDRGSCCLDRGISLAVELRAHPSLKAVQGLLLPCSSLVSLASEHL